MTVEIAVLRVYAEVFDRLRDIFAEEIHVNVAERCVDDRGVVYLLHVRSLCGRYDVLLRRFLVENISIALLALRVIRLASGKHVETIFLVSRAEQRRIGPVHFHRRVLGSLHLDGQRGGSFPRFSLYTYSLFRNIDRSIFNTEIVIEILLNNTWNNASCIGRMFSGFPIILIQRFV